MKIKPTIVYLISNYDSLSNIFKFIKNYKKYKAGHAHNLIICYKNCYNKNLDKSIKKKINPFKYKKFIDFGKNDFDWGSYKRVAKKNKNKILFFFNCHSYPIKNNWLKFFLNHYKSKTVLAPTGSFQSISSSSLNGFYFKNLFHRLYYGFFNMINFPLFPNPHIRSNCFMISANDFLNLNLINCEKKIHAWLNESGRKSMTKQLLDKGFKLLVVNNENKKFLISHWKKSETYAVKKQGKLLISDKHTREYMSLNNERKKIYEKNVWGFKF